MTMLYIWAIGAVVSLATIAFLLKVWYDPEELRVNQSTPQGGSDES